MLETITAILQLGIGGLAVFLLYDIIRTHLKRNTEILTELTKVMRDIHSYIIHKS